ncbi:hypothetical protein [Pararhizobium arenae]|uniref:hypothetical protein n=1 Tax=Pararhizobium arenae TaxID=1856850 RepID=UPI00315AB1EE
MSRPAGDPRLIEAGPSSFGSADRLARDLGWFSIGLGLVELFAAEKITGALGMRGNENLVRAFGVREVASGIMTLSVDRQAGLQSRIVGDALDIATLATAMRPDNRKRGNAALALLLVAGVTFLDLIAKGAIAARHRRENGKVRSYSDRSGFPQGIEAARYASHKKLQDKEDISAGAGSGTKSGDNAT